MWKDKNKDAPIVEFLGWLLFLSLLVQGILLLLEPYSISYLESGHLTVGYIIYAILGMFFSTPAPLIDRFADYPAPDRRDNCKGIFQKDCTYAQTIDGNYRYRPILCNLCVCGMLRNSERFPVVYDAAWFYGNAALCGYSGRIRLARLFAAGA